MEETPDKLTTFCYGEPKGKPVSLFHDIMQMQEKQLLLEGLQQSFLDENMT